MAVNSDYFCFTFRPRIVGDEDDIAEESTYVTVQLVLAPQLVKTRKGVSLESANGDSQVLLRIRLRPPETGGVSSFHASYQAIRNLLERHPQELHPMLCPYKARRRDGEWYLFALSKPDSEKLKCGAERDGLWLELTAAQTIANCLEEKLGFHRVQKTQKR